MERTCKDVTSILKLSELKWISHFLVLKKAQQEESETEDMLML
jgi:hypothetical protein